MPNPDQKIWLDALSYLRQNSPDLCRQWFDEIEPLGAVDGVFRARVNQSVKHKYLSHQCADKFNEALQSVSGRLLTIRFFGPGEEPPRPQPKPASNGHAVMAESKPSLPRAHSTPLVSANARRRYDSITISPDHSFEHFVIGPENRLAVAASHAVAQNPGGAYNPLFIHGGVGLGKTHLLQAICIRIEAERPGLVIHYVSCDSFMNHFMEAVQEGQMAEFRHRFRDVDMLVIDDIHFLAKLDRTQEEFFHTFNTLHQSGKQIVLSSDAAPQDIPDLEARLISRFNSGLVVEMGTPCYETRVQIVKQKSRLRGLEMPDDVACFIASRIASNIRELEGAITRVQMQAITDRVSVTLELARAALGAPAATADTRPEITITSIIDSVVDHYGIKLSDLTSKRRQKSIAHPRQVCMYLARRYTRYSLEEIGGYFGGRDHTTVMHAVRTVEQRRSQDGDLSRVIGSLEARLAPPGSGAGPSNTPAA